VRCFCSLLTQTRGMGIGGMGITERERARARGRGFAVSWAVGRALPPSRATTGRIVSFVENEASTDHLHLPRTDVNQRARAGHVTKRR
jgi:hypothetical protein